MASWSSGMILAFINKEVRGSIPRGARLVSTVAVRMLCKHKVMSSNLIRGYYIYVLFVWVHSSVVEQSTADR